MQNIAKKGHFLTIRRRKQDRILIRNGEREGFAIDNGWLMIVVVIAT